MPDTEKMSIAPMAIAAIAFAGIVLSNHLFAWSCINKAIPPTIIKSYDIGTIMQYHPKELNTIFPTKGQKKKEGVELVEQHAIHTLSKYAHAYECYCERFVYSTL
jgi:hypothetical protein